MFFSPYSGTDANCGNPLIISIEELISEGLLDAKVSLIVKKVT